MKYPSGGGQIRLGGFQLAVSVSLAGLADRMIRAAKLDTELYEEVEHDQGATGQAAIVVVGTSIAAGIGGAFAGNAVLIIVLPIVSIVAWALFAWLTYFIGTRFLAGPDTSADWGELARTLGFAKAPSGLLIFAVIPELTAILGFVVTIWVLITTVVAVRAALDFSTWRAVATVIVGSIAQSTILIVTFSLLV